VTAAARGAGEQVEQRDWARRLLYQPVFCDPRAESWPPRRGRHSRRTHGTDEGRQHRCEAVRHRGLSGTQALDGEALVSGPFHTRSIFTREPSGGRSAKQASRHSRQGGPRHTRPQTPLRPPGLRGRFSLPFSSLTSVRQTRRPTERGRGNGRRGGCCLKLQPAVDGARGMGQRIYDLPSFHAAQHQVVLRIPI